jgi:hypothetical protein
MLFAACGQPPPPSKPKVEKDPRLAAIEEKIAQTTPEGKSIIEKVLAMNPEVNEQTSGQTLGAIIDDFTKNKGAYNMEVIGWEASQKKNDRWKLVCHYKDYSGQFTAAEWEYNPQTNKVYPFEFKNAKDFWTAPESPSKSKKK